MHTPTASGVAATLLVCAASPALAVPPSADVTHTARGAGEHEASPGALASRTIAAVRRSGPIAVDGVLDEDSWERARPSGDFWQREPHEGVPPQQATEFRVLYDDRALYVGVRAHDREADKIRGLLTRRDTDSASDWIMVGIDSHHDRRTSFTFALNPAGVQRDLLLYDDVQEDASWDAVWDGSASVDDGGWVAEFRIPFSQLRFSDADEQRWGFQIARVVSRTREQSFWSATPRSRPQMVSLFGEVHSIRDIKPSRRVEIVPYTIGGARISDVPAGNPFRDDLEPELGVGADFRLGLTSGLTLSGTINPDFGQVEADPSQVNLSDQEAFFAERRPFFLEGGDIFRFGISQGDGDGAVEQLFYPRRIGATPTLSPNGDYVSADPTVSITGAAKVSGKTAGGWSLGALSAMTAEETARIATAGGSERDVTIEPLANYSVLRVRKDLNQGRTSIGAAATGVHRRLKGTGLGFMHKRAYGGGLQLDHRSKDGDWVANLRVLGSSVHGSPAAIDATQRASQRYYQRPDASHLNYDPNRTRLSGVGMLGSLSRTGHKHWRAAVGMDSRSPGLELNDLGFQFRSDYIVGWAWTQYRDEQPGRVLRRYAINGNVWANSNWQPDVTATGGNVNGNITLNNNWNAGLGLGTNRDQLSTGLLRGGPAVRGMTGYNAWGNVSTDSSKNVSAGLSGNGWLQPESRSWSARGSADVSLQARSNLTLSLGAFASRRADDNQFVANVMTPDGETYVLARIDQTTVGLTARADFTLSPDLTLQVYAQPFVSAGRFGNYKTAADVRAQSYGDRFDAIAADQLMDSGSGTLVVDRDGGGADFELSRPDFNVRELNSTVVLRWQYRPGSSLFVIWSHSRDSASDRGQFRLGSDVDALLDPTGEHVLLVKLNYWWGR